MGANFSFQIYTINPVIRTYLEMREIEKKLISWDCLLKVDPPSSIEYARRFSDFVCDIHYEGINLRGE